MERNHREEHSVAPVGWLRAAVPGANDGIVCAASLIVGVAAGVLSMAAGAYVSVSPQSDTEAADILRERAEIAADPAEELRALRASTRTGAVARACPAGGRGAARKGPGGGPCPGGAGDLRT